MIEQSTILIVDTETTGLNPPQDEAVEIATVTLDKDLKEVDFFRSFCLPVAEISVGASAVHSITKEQLLTYPSPQEVLPEVPDNCIWVGHNAHFDRAILHWLKPSKTIDTLDLARTYLPRCEKHSLQYLAEYLNLPVEQAHTALSDCRTTASLLRVLVELSGLSIETFIDRALALRMVHVMPWGVHKGKVLTNVPVPYLRWVLTQKTIHPNLRMSIETYLSVV